MTSSDVIVVRSLAESDLGIFAAHREAARSKQRAININADVARELVSETLFAAGGGHFLCICRFGTSWSSVIRSLSKVGKNWRLGGPKIEGAEFATLDSKDFVLIRSVANNDGTHPITLTFVGKTFDRVIHAGIAAIVGQTLERSMIHYAEGQAGFADIAKFCPRSETGNSPSRVEAAPRRSRQLQLKAVPPMPEDEAPAERSRPRTFREKLRSPHLLERMLKVAGDLSAPAQLRFMETVEQLASQLREVLLATDRIGVLEKNHSGTWHSVAHKSIGFVDGGLANLQMLGSAPIAARVGGYMVKPGDTSEGREQFTVLKYLIDELYASDSSGVYSDSFPDIGALRDAARISIEAAGAVRMVHEHPDMYCLLTHGALVNPVSRYTDVMLDGKVRYRFPDFSRSAIRDLLPSTEPERSGRERNFISVHLRQLELLREARPLVCGVIERESSTSSVIRGVLDSLEDDIIRPLLPKTPAEWKAWFRRAVDPSDGEDMEGQRITDSLLFRCVLEPGEYIKPIELDRNERRRAPEAWRLEIVKYPKPFVSYLQVTEWSSPIRLELFQNDPRRFKEVANLVMHCALLLPRYAFPAGLDIVDKFARIPNWMARPVNTNTAVRVLKSALESGDTHLFDSLRRMLCGSTREWLLRPTAFR